MIYKDSTLKSENWKFLKALKKKSRIPNAILFHGSNGIGKQSIAIEFAAYINCQGDLIDSACGHCSSCSKIKTRSSVLLTGNSALIGLFLHSLSILHCTLSK